MKKLALGAMIVAAIAASSNTASAGDHYICTYYSSKVYVAFAGSDVGGAACRAFNSGFGGVRVGYPSGSPRCMFESLKYDIDAVVYSRNRTYGRLFCQVLRGKMRGWYFDWA